MEQTLPVAPGSYWWRVHCLDGGVVHAASGLVRVARVDIVVLTWRGCMSGGVRTLSGYLRIRMGMG